MSSNDLNLLKAITDKRGEKYTWESKRAVAKIIEILRETPEGNPMWQGVYDAIVVAYDLLADWGEDEPARSGDSGSSEKVIEP